MLILTNGLTENSDEGFLNVATNLVKRIKKACPNTVVVSYERSSRLTDRYIELNKLLLSKELISLIRSCNEDLLYIPFPAKAIAVALRIFILSILVKKKLKVILVMRTKFNFFTSLLVLLSRADIIVLSTDSESFYKKYLPSKKIMYIKTGVDTARFIPVSAEKTASLKVKYGFATDKPILLHVGHLKYGRNLDVLKKMNSTYQILIVVSSMTKEDRDDDLRRDLESLDNIRIFDEYFDNIEEIYQLADAYFFPTVEEGNCIDVPLSCLEAAACNKPVITTSYGEMKEFRNSKGFFFIDDTVADINDIVAEALACDECLTREAILDYDWNYAVELLSD